MVWGGGGFQRGRGRRTHRAAQALDADDDAITHVASAHQVRHGKPAPDQVERALALAGAPADRAVFVGDSVWDMRAATRAGVPAIGLLSGGLPRADLLDSGAVEIHGDPAELLAALEDSAFARRCVE